MQHCHRSNRDSLGRAGGFTLAELSAGVVVLIIVAAVLVNHLTVNYSAARTQKDKVFAYTKAQAILSEIQSYVDRGAITAAIQLDELDDGVTNKPTLTITEEPTAPGSLINPDHPLSGNFMRNSDWVWSRRITVRPFQGLNNRNVRYVTVRLYKKDGAGIDRVVANLSSVVNSVGSAFPTTQVFDIYLLAAENIPGWWVFMEAIVPFVESAITDLESRNPGLKLRTHWITKASYGRNQVYRPLINDQVDSTQPVERSYFYPGRMPTGNASTFYYVPDKMKARMSFDGVERHGYDQNDNPYPYALADFYNHAMRYPREKAYHDLRVGEVKKRKAAIAQAIALGNPPPAPLDDMDEEPTLRLFYEDLSTNPDKYRNALIINLHGELIPMPSLRNYSDACKSPENMPYMRVVTHPEQLRTERDPAGVTTENVVLRVYAYTTLPDLYMAASLPDRMQDPNPIAIQVMGIDLTDGTQPNGLIPLASIRDLRGGVFVNGTKEYSGFQPSSQTYSADDMYYEVLWQPPDPPAGIPEGYTLFKLYHTPVIAPYIQHSNGEWHGLLADKRSRLYNLEYIPSCTGPGPTVSFAHDLSADGNGPKNSARWEITIPKTVFSTKRFVDPQGNYYDPADDVMVTVRTRMWDPTLPDPLLAGTMYPKPAQPGYPDPIQPDNFSETYTWWTDSPLDVPMTERSQFQGDPRHNPYKDLLAGSTDFPDGYNWYHDKLDNDGEDGRDGYPGIDGAKLENRWEGAMRQDVPRFFELLRTGLTKSNTVYTTLTGFSYYYMGHGNEIGYDAANGYPTSIPVNRGPWWISSIGTNNVQNIIGYRSYLRNGDNPYWWGMTWLGELYPDHVYASQWIKNDSGGNPRGNLDAAGWATNKFFRWQDYSVYLLSNNRAYGTQMKTAMQRTSVPGCTSFFNIDNGPGRFAHSFSGGNGSLVGAGLQLGANYNYPIPASTPINRPWSVTSSAATPDEYAFPPYSTNRFTANVARTYYDHPSGDLGSGMIELLGPGGVDSGYVVVNGISQAVASGSSFIAKYSLLTMVQSFLEAGDGSLTNRIKMPARVEIQSPTEITEIANQTNVPIKFDTFWVRWDGQPYSTTTPTSFAENESELVYVVMYSRDNGVSWLHVQDSSAATPGVKPTSSTVLVGDSGPGPETVGWSTPKTQYPEGSYLIRVEAYRNNQALHYSQHQAKIFISWPQP